MLHVIVLGELWAGFEVGNRRGINRDELDEFPNSPRVTVASIVNAMAERYARIYTYLRKNGRQIPTNDLWIAASVMEHSALLLTADAHFSHLPQILMQHISSNEG